MCNTLHPPGGSEQQLSHLTMLIVCPKALPHFILGPKQDAMMGSYLGTRREAVPFLGLSQGARIQQDFCDVIHPVLKGREST